MANSKPRFDPQEYLSHVSTGITVLEFEKDKMIYAQREKAEHVFYVLKGKIKLTVVQDNKEAVISIFSVGDFFGEDCVFNSHPARIGTTRAMSPSRVARIARQTMIDTMARESLLSEKFMAYILTNSRHTQRSLIDQMFNKIEKRLARTLLLLAEVGRSGEVEKTIIGNYSQETLAEMVGTNRPKVNKFMNKFRALGYIDYNGHIKVNNSLLNVVLYDEPELPHREKQWQDIEL